SPRTLLDEFGRNPLLLSSLTPFLIRQPSPTLRVVYRLLMPRSIPRLAISRPKEYAPAVRMVRVHDDAIGRPPSWNLAVIERRQNRLITPRPLPASQNHFRVEARKPRTRINRRLDVYHASGQPAASKVERL